jgi:hypothetical protein
MKPSPLQSYYSKGIEAFVHIGVILLFVPVADKGSTLPSGMQHPLQYTGKGELPVTQQHFARDAPAAALLLRCFGFCLCLEVSPFPKWAVHRD